MGTWKLGLAARVAGEDIAYEILGEGAPVVLVHGYPGNSYEIGRAHV